MEFIAKKIFRNKKNGQMMVVLNKKFFDVDPKIRDLISKKNPKRLFIRIDKEDFE